MICLGEKRILLVGQYFYPEQFRINDICSQWVKRGYDVDVVTGIPNYPYGKFYDGYGLFKKRKEKYNGINIYRIPQIPRRQGLFMLIVNYFSFVVSGFIWSLFSKKNPDIVFNYSTSPILHALPGVWFAKRRGIPFYIYILDLWPDSVESVTKVHSAFLNRLLQKVCDYIYRNSEKIFVASKGFVNPIVSRGLSLDKVVFWPQYAEDFYIPLDEESVSISEIPKDKFNIIFAGNFGYAQGLEILPDVASLIKENNDSIRICMVGDGRFKPRLIELIRKKNVEDIFCFVDKQPAERIPEFMAYCDAALIMLQDDPLFAETIPAKIQSCMACGAPVVLSVSGEAKMIIDEAKCGITCEPSNVEALYDAMCEISRLKKSELKNMRNNALVYFKDNFESNLLLSKMDEYLFN